MSFPTVLLFLVLGCTSPESSVVESQTTCESGFVADGTSCLLEACGSGRWGDLPVDDATIHVDGTAVEGGDGTEEAPFTTIQRGLDRAGSLGGSLVAVAAGIYPETLEWTSDHADVRLAGRCRDLVILDASVGDEGTPGIGIDAGDAAVEVSGLTVNASSSVGLEVSSGTVVMRNASILGSTEYGVMVQHYVDGGTSDLTMEACNIEENTAVGLVAWNPGTEVSLVDTSVTDTLPADRGSFGAGVLAADGAILSMVGSLIEANAGFGLSVSTTGTRVTLQDTTVRDTRPDVNGEVGWGISLAAGPSLLMEGGRIEENIGFGLYASTPGTTVALRDTTVSDTQPDAKGASGWGVGIQVGAVLSAEGVTIEGSTGFGLAVTNPGTRVNLRDTTVRDTQPDSSSAIACGVGVADGAFLSLSGGVIEGSIGLGLCTSDPGTRVSLQDMIVRDTQLDANGESGLGIACSLGVTVSAEGCLIESSSSVGIYAVDPGTQVLLVDTTVRSTRRAAMDGHGYGVAFADGATLFAETSLIEDSTGVGLLVFNPGTRATLWDTTVRDTEVDAKGVNGVGVEVLASAVLSMTDGLIEGNSTAGLVAFHPGTQVNLWDTTVRDTRPDSNGDFGYGIQVNEGANLVTERCLIEGNTMVGLHADSSGTDVTLRDTVVQDTRPDADGIGGYGLLVGNGAALRAEGSLIDGNRAYGVIASNAGTEVTLLHSTVSHTTAGTNRMSSSASGVSVQIGAFLYASDLEVSSNQGPGILVIDGEAVMECVGCMIRDNQFAGAAAVRSGVLSISDAIIEGTTANVNLLGGAGVYAWPWNGDPPTVILTNTLVQDNPVAGVWLIGNGAYVLTGNTISGGSGEAFGSGTRCGDAILALEGVEAWDGASGLLLQDSVLQDAAGAGVFLDDSSALVSGNAYSANNLDLVVQNRSCDAMPGAYAEAPHPDFCPIYDYPTCRAEFFFVAMPAEPVEE